jgi:hypothetical protein
MRLVGHVACMMCIRTAHEILVGKISRKRILGRRSRMWEDNIKIDFAQIELAHDKSTMARFF